MKVNANGVSLSDFPIGLGYNPKMLEMYVANKTDIRCISIWTGKTLRILANLVDSNKEMFEVKLWFDFQHFLISSN
jgi:hypothetical protein